MVRCRCVAYSDVNRPTRFANRQEEVPMRRMFYLGMLFMLQCALLVQAGPPLWRGLRLDTVLTSSNAGHIDYSPLAVTGLAVIGVVLTLSFPTVALLRHCHCG